MSLHTIGMRCKPASSIGIPKPSLSLGKTKTGRREAEHLADVDAVRHDLDIVAREAGELRELLCPLLRHRDVPHAGHRARHEIPRRPVASQYRVALVEVRD